MVAPKFRSRTYRRLDIKMPGGKTKRVYKARMPKAPHCAECGEELKGIPRLSSVMARKMPKSTKTVERPYGGFLCSACARAKLKQEARLGQ